MSTYVRFETAWRCRGTNRRLGLFHAAGRLQEEVSLDDQIDDHLASTLAWFNKNLSVPIMEATQWRGIFWFRGSSLELITKMWDLAVLLQGEGVFVQKRWTRNPGRIVYEDNFQVAAIPSHRC